MTPVRIPVSAAFAVPDGVLTGEVHDALRVIDRIHGDGLLPRIPLTWEYRSDREGFYRTARPSGRPIRIVLDIDARFRRLVLLHEIGHFLDHQAIGIPDVFASGRHGLMSDWRHAVRASTAFVELADLSRAQTGSVREPHGGVSLVEVQTDLVRHLGRYDELWARSYAQFIVARSSDPWLRAELDERRARQPDAIYYHFQWDDDEFVPIEAAIARLFRRLEWLI